MSDWLEISVSPIEAASFAGQTFACQITFRNTLPPNPNLPNLARQNSLAASRSSTLSESLSRRFSTAQTPTLPALDKNDSHLQGPRSANYVADPEQSPSLRLLPSRQGLIGRSADASSKALALELSQQARRTLYNSKRVPISAKHRNSYSVAGSEADVQDRHAQDAALAEIQQSSYHPTPRNGDAAARNADVQNFSGAASSGTQTPFASSSQESLPISRSLSSHSPNTIAHGPTVSTPRSSVDFYNLGRNESMESIMRDSINQYASIRKHKSSKSVPFPNHHFPGRGSSWITSDARLPQDGSQSLIWAFAQLQGSFEVDETIIKPREFHLVKESLFGSGQVRPLSVNSGIVGGGFLEPTLTPTKSGGWREWLWSNDSSATNGSVSPSAYHVSQPGSSSSVTPISPTSSLAKGSLGYRREQALQEKAVPILSMPPSVLAVDLTLAPGESQTYTYSLVLPGDLPPSFRGRSISFNYTLVVGTNRAPDRASGELQPRSRLFKIPLRIYNNVAENGARPFFDLTNPIVWSRDEATVSESEGVEKPAAHSAAIGRANFDAYACKLLDNIFTSPLSGRPAVSLSPELNTIISPLNSPTQHTFDSGPSSRPEMQIRSAMRRPEPVGLLEEEVDGCKAAIEVISRTSPKASFDINKDGMLIASLTLAKASFRLGETIHGSLVMNAGECRLLRLSVRLETHELVETSIALRKAKFVRQATRRTYAEQHEVALDCARSPISLTIPSGAAPDFATSGVKLQWSLRLTFLVLIAPKHSESAASMTQPAMPLGSSPLPSATPQNHQRSRSFAVSGDLEPLSAPVEVATNSSHLMPIPAESNLLSTSYRSVPDLSFRPALFQSTENSTTAAAKNAMSHGRTLSTPEAARSSIKSSAVLLPAKWESIDCSIVLKVYPAEITYRPIEFSSFT